MSAPRPVLVVTNHVPPDRAGAFAALHAREGIELALFGGRSHHATAGLADPGVPHRRVRSATSSTSPPAGATARSSRGRPGASPCRPPGAGPAAPARRSCCGAPCGRPCARRRTSSPHRCWRRSYATPTSSSTYGPHVSAPRAAPRAPGPSSSRPQAVDGGVLVGAAATRGAPASGRPRSRSPAARPPRRAARCCVRPGARPAWAAAAGRSSASAPASARRAAASPARWRSGPAADRRARRPGRVRRPRGALAADPLLPRALGVGGQRGHAPRHDRPHLRRRRRGRRRPRPRRPHRARRPGRRRRRARRRAAAPGAATPRCARGWPRRPGRRSRAHTFAAWAQGFSRALAVAGAAASPC